MCKDVPDWDKEDYPSIDLAYDLSVKSYEWAVTRLLNAERRIDNTLRLGLTGTAVIPTIAFAVNKMEPNPQYINVWGFLALVICVVATGVGVWARGHGQVAFINPALLYDQYLADSCEQFQVDIIHAAKEDFVGNVHLVNEKSEWADIMAALYGVELFFGIIWLFSI